MRKFNALLLIIITILSVSCDNNSTVMQKNITGKAGETIIVMSDQLWEGEAGKMMRESLAQQHIALPQDEPLFDLVQIPHNSFKRIFQSTRNIIVTEVSSNVEKEGVTFKRNVWAYPQSVIEIKAKNKENFQKYFKNNQNKIISFFIKAERDRLSMNYKKYFEQSVYNTLKDKFNITMFLPSGFNIASESENFVWSRYETPEISQGVMVFTLPYNNEQAFTEKYMVNKIDSVLKLNIPGPTKGSYMTINKDLDQVFKARNHNGNYATEMRGLWRVEHDFMGGPYISLAELDEEKQQIIVTFSYVYAPSKKKRNLLRQTEAMLYSLKFNNQKDKTEK